jgi:hypothetical protein
MKSSAAKMTGGQTEEPDLTLQLSRFIAHFSALRVASFDCHVDLETFLTRLIYATTFEPTFSKPA